MNEKFKEDQIEELRRVFNSIDTDGDGNISASELSFALRQAGIVLSTEDLNDLMSELDLDNDGKVDFAEFLNLAAKSVKEIDSEEELKDIFMIFDRENKGVISPAQIKYVLRCLQENLTDEEIDDVVFEGDKDGDGLLSFEEFLGIMHAKEPVK
jgi:Ca2+-binding EF-hand superfamily protein